MSINTNPIEIQPEIVSNSYFPELDDYAIILEEIYKNQYYTNHGPLAKKLEKQLETFLGVSNVLVVSNDSIGLLMTIVALELKGSIVIPSNCNAGLVETILLAGLVPIYCDVDPKTMQLSSLALSNIMTSDICAVLAVDMWGQRCEQEIMTIANAYDSQVIFDSTSSFGSKYAGSFIHGSSSIAIFSFNSECIVTTQTGGCIATDDNVLADKLRNIRSSYGVEKVMNVPVTVNGRFSELQAGIGLWALENLHTHMQHYKAIRDEYLKGLQCTKGVELYAGDSNIEFNNQHIVAVFDKHFFASSCEKVYEALKMKNIKCQIISTPQYTDDSDCHEFKLLLPTGKGVEPGDIKEILSLIADLA